MGAIVRNVVNDQLLRLSYKDPKNIKRFLRNWGGLEGLSEKGDTVATCILTDLKTVTAIDLDKYHRATYGEITALRKSVATVKGTGLYSGITAEVHLRYIEKLMRGGGSVGSDCKKCSKRSITKAEL